MPFSFLVICLFVAVLGLPCFVWALSDCSEWRLLPGCARTAHTWAFLEEHQSFRGSSGHQGFGSCSAPRLSYPAASGSDPFPMHWLADS